MVQQALQDLEATGKGDSMHKRHMRRTSRMLTPGGSSVASVMPLRTKPLACSIGCHKRTPAYCQLPSNRRETPAGQDVTAIEKTYQE